MLAIILSMFLSTATVTEVYPETEAVICITEDGNEWEFYGDEFSVGDHIVVEIVNDRVIDAR